jgi:hypothetical protein
MTTPFNVARTRFSIVNYLSANSWRLGRFRTGSSKLARSLQTLFPGGIPMRMATLIALALGFSGSKLVRMIGELEPNDMLQPLGLRQRRSLWPQSLALLGTGAAIGGATALLLAPSSGKETRAALSNKANALLETVTDEARQLVGGHGHPRNGKRRADTHA